MSATKRKRTIETVSDPDPPAPTDPDEELHWSDEEGSYVDGIYIPPPIKRHEAAATTTRLMITKITNNFFKSYAKETVLGPFSKCFNAIVGPNGSGKSNVIDSMLFVFGYRATRIRCKKLSVLLHNSEKYRNVQSCSVAVHFCQIVDKPGNDFEIVPGSEFVVSRTANKDNSSYYELNGRRVLFKEVAKLLRGLGIDLDHNRFLILQGEVEEIATMKCKGANENETGMLEYLEDIIGTTQYKKPLFELTERIEYLSAVRTEKLNRLNLVQKKLDELRAPMEEAIDFLRTENKITLCRNFLYQKEIFLLEEKFKEVKEDQDKITESRNNIKASLKELANKKLEQENLLKQESGKYDKLQRKRDKLKEAYNATDKKHVQLQAEMVQSNNNRKKLKSQLEEEKQKLIQLENVPEKNRQDIGEYEAKEVEMTTKQEKLEQDKMKLLASIKDETKDLQAEKEKLEVKLGKLKKTVDETKSAYNLAECELKVARSQEETEANKLKKLQDTVTTCNETIKQRTQQLSELKRKIPPTEKSLSTAKKELEVVCHEQAQLSRQIHQVKMQLEESRSSMQMTKSRGKVLDCLMQQKREGKCPGLYGRLGDLGGIDQKYDVAVSTACGPLDNIVVDTVDTAQWCIEYLKRHGIGRTTFIALDQQEHFRRSATSRIQTPENVHRLFDLIQIQDEAVRTAFYYALRDTLVADDLDQGTRIAYGAQRYRVVTLKGDLIEVSGTMSGGGRAIRGRMGQSVVASTMNPQELQRMETNLQRQTEQIKQLTQKQASLQSQINTLEPELNSMKSNLEKFSQDLQSLKAQQPTLQEELRKQENIAKSTKSDQTQIAKLTAIVQSKKAKFDDASDVARELQVDVDKLTETIKEKTSGKVKTIDRDLNELKKKIEKCKSEITRMKVAITTSERNCKKCTQKIATLEKNIDDLGNRLSEMKTERETIEEDANKLLKCIEEITQQLEEGKEDFSGLKEEVEKLTAEEKKLLLRQVDVEQTFKNINEKVGRCNAECHQRTAKLAQLKLHQIDGDSCELVKFSTEELQAKNPEVMELEMQAAQDSIKNSKPNLNVIQNYKAEEKLFTEKAQELEAVTAKRNEMKNLHDQVKNQRKNEFLIGYNIIRVKLKEMYQMITLGGDADFEILDSFDPFTEGVQLNVRPPRKSWKAISNLSGGEKTLSSLALVFALHYYKPSPLYVMDEIDAALDFKNVSIVGHYIKERTKNAQFIIISLRPNMFELCDYLIGIYKIYNCTRCLTIEPDKCSERAEEEKKTADNAEDQVVETVENVQQNGDDGSVIGDSHEEPMDVSV